MMPCPPRRAGSCNAQCVALTIGVIGALLLTGCATVDINQSIARVNLDAGSVTGGKLSLAQSEADRVASQSSANALLAKPLTQGDAVHLALINSPAMQAMLAQSWADAASAAQAGRLPNPILTLERVRTPSETEIGRMLAFGLLDVFTLPQRYRTANARALRHWTALIWLNHDYEGGQTDFPDVGVRVKGGVGDLLLFHNVTADGLPDQRMMHAGLPVTSGVKWMASRWIRGRDYLA